MKLTPAELTVLGLIIERPQHGYDVQQVIEHRGIRQWMSIGFSSIYYLLARLEKWGLVNVPEAPATAKSRRVFHVTSAGREVAAKNARTLIEEFGSYTHPFVAGIANLPLLSHDEYADALRTRLAQVEERIASLQQTQQTRTPLPLPTREVLSYSLTLLEAEKSWLAARVRSGARKASSAREPDPRPT